MNTCCKMGALQITASSADPPPAAAPSLVYSLSSAEGRGSFGGLSADLALSGSIRFRHGCDVLVHFFPSLLLLLKCLLLGSCQAFKPLGAVGHGVPEGTSFVTFRKARQDSRYRFRASSRFFVSASRSLGLTISFANESEERDTADSPVRDICRSSSATASSHNLLVSPKSSKKSCVIC
jgi:hypothetical protein